MKNINEQAQNKVNIVGKLLDVTFRTGTMKDGRPYESANLTIRVTQTFGGQTEVSEIPVSMFAAKFTSKNLPNPSYEQIQELKTMQTAQNVGIDNADTVRIGGATLQENSYVARSGQLVKTWRVNASFVGKVKASDIASFHEEIFIMDMHEEEDKDGDTTGRLVVRAGIVQYKGKLDVVDFVVEQPDAVDFISRNWEPNQTVNVAGRIRVTSKESHTSGNNSGWGEELPDTTTVYIRELIITTGDNEPHEEEFAYDPDDIKKAFNVRQAMIEQMRVDATQAAPKAEKTSTKYDWD